MMQPTIFKNKQGGGYIADSPEIDVRFKKQPFKIIGLEIYPGQKTDIDFFAREMEYIGRCNNALLFLIGVERSLFGKWYYYQEVFLVSETRIFIMYAKNSGRDYIYIDGKWK